MAGHRRYVLGVEDEDAPLGRDEAQRLEVAVGRWQRTGRWGEGADG